VCDRIGIFASGRLIGQGTMEELAGRFGDGRREIEVGLDLPEGADDTDARAALRAVPGVAAVDDGSRPGDPWVLTVAPGHEPSEVRSRVLAVVAAEALPLASIRAVLPSLEDVYRRAVAEPAKVPARGDSSAAGRSKALRSGAPAATPVAATPIDQAHPIDRPDADVAPEQDRAAWLEPVEPVVLPSDTPEEDPR